MRRCSAKDRRQARRRGFCLLAVLVLAAGVLSLNRYVNTVVKPTLHELAEYEARSAAVQAMNRAVAAELTRSPALCDALFTQGFGLVSLDAAAAGAAQTQFVSAVQTEMDALPEICYAVPFGSLTNNSLLSGLGPGWLLSIRPKGYVQGGDTRDNAVALHQYHTVQRGFAAVRHRQHDFGRQHGHTDCCGGLSAGKPARLRRYSERLCLRFGLNLPPQMWYTKLIPTNGV